MSFRGTGLRKKHNRKGTARFSEKTEEGENPTLDWEEKSGTVLDGVSQAGGGRVGPGSLNMACQRRGRGWEWWLRLSIEELRGKSCHY